MNVVSCRADGSTLNVISPTLLHIFDQTMAMLPFATRTDMYEALKKTDTRAADIEIFLASLREEHNMPGVRAQLKTLWLRHVKALYPEEVEEQAAAGASGAGAPVVGGAVRARATTPPPTPPGSPKP